MNGRLSPSRVDLLSLLIKYEPAVLVNIPILNGKSVEKAKTFEVKEDGRVVLYFGNGPKWLQRFFSTYETVSIIDISVNLADTMSGSGEARNTTVFNGLMQSVLKEAVENKDLDCIVDIFVDSIRNGSKGELCSKYINKKTLDKFVKEKNIKVDDNVKYRMSGVIGVTDGRSGRNIPIQIPVELWRVIDNG